MISEYKITGIKNDENDKNENDMMKWKQNDRMKRGWWNDENDKMKMKMIKWRWKW